MQILFSLLLLHLSVITLTKQRRGVHIPKIKVYSGSRKVDTNCDHLMLRNDIFIACPSIKGDVTEIEVTIELGQSVKILCTREDVQFVDFRLTVGKISEFKSRKCNLVDHLAQIFTKWNISGAEVLNIENFSRDDLILRKKQFDNVNVLQVKAVYMHRSNIIGIEADTFQNFINLETISFKWNKITIFPCLSYLRKLRTIDFELNKLTTLNESIFTNMSALTVLELRNNQIKYLPEKLLYPLTGLTDLSLTDLIEIPADFFRLNRALDILILSSHNLSSISEDVFANLTNLTVLSLTDTSLETLPEDLLMNQASLHKLQLQRNRFKILPGGIFRNLLNLTFLDLAENQITSIGTNFCSGMSRLQTLDLSRNKISHISANAFKNVHFQLVDLSYNNLSNSRAGTAFMNQTHSTTLNLSHNLYRSVPHVLERSTVYLNMSYNQLETIDMLFKIDCDFSFNAIKKISLLVSEQYQTLEDVGPKYTTLKGNPIDCGCDVFPLVQYFDGSYGNKSIYKKVSLDDAMQCHSPTFLAGANLNSLKSRSFICDDEETYKCPEECCCKLHPYYKSFNITCNNRNLSKPPTLPRFTSKTYKDISGFHSMFTIEKLVVDLSNNFIKRFTENDSSYVNASELYLFNNELNLIDWLPQRLEVLQLNGNKLEKLDYKAILALNNSRSLKHLALRDNMWNCDCKLLNFTKLVKAKHLEYKIPFQDTILCADGRKVVNLLEDNLCNFGNQRVLITIATCFITLVAVVLSSVATNLFKKYEYHVKVWIYSKPLLMRFVTEDDLAEDKVYDAFLSYSHKDESFVSEELLSALEGCLNPYKLCIHSRDWVAGEFIIDQIIKSVERSKRTIFILSPNFLESEWAKFEFSVAHRETIKEKGHRLIIILYGDIDLKSVENQELRHYLSGNTYLKWGDPWFWKKLRYVLPHKKGKENSSSGPNNDDETRSMIESMC